MNGVDCVGLGDEIQLAQRDHGYAIAELAMAIPALLIMVAMSVSLLGLTVTQVKLESSAALGARIIGRGEQLPNSFLNSLPPGTEVIVKSEAEVIEVRLIAKKEMGFSGLPLVIELNATSRARHEQLIEGLDLQ
jgi:hypothetical protein